MSGRPGPSKSKSSAGAAMRKTQSRRRTTALIEELKKILPEARDEALLQAELSRRRQVGGGRGFLIEMLEAVIERVRAMTSSKGAHLSEPQPQHEAASARGRTTGEEGRGGVPGKLSAATARITYSHEDIQALSMDRVALTSSRTHGLLRVRLDNWMVLESNQAMHSFCSWAPIRGFLGQRLSLFIHPDDFEQLMHFQEKMHKRIQKKTTENMAGAVLSVRMLRMCMDRNSPFATNSLLSDYRELSLELAYLWQDDTEDGQWQGLFSATMPPDSTEPLETDEAFWKGWNASAKLHEGVYVLDQTGDAPRYDIMDCCEKSDQAGRAFNTDDTVSSHGMSYMAEVMSEVGGHIEDPDASLAAWRSRLVSNLRLHLSVSPNRDGPPSILRCSRIVGSRSGLQHWSPFLKMDLSGALLPAGDNTWTGGVQAWAGSVCSGDGSGNRFSSAGTHSAFRGTRGVMMRMPANSNTAEVLGLVWSTIEENVCVETIWMLDASTERPFRTQSRTVRVSGPDENVLASQASKDPSGFFFQAADKYFIHASGESTAQCRLNSGRLRESTGHRQQKHKQQD